MVESVDADVTEIETYRHLFSVLEKFELSKLGVSHIKDVAPSYFAGAYEDTNEKKSDRAWYLILEDLSDTHHIEDFNVGLNPDQVKIFSQHFALLHERWDGKMPFKLLFIPD